MFGCLDCGGAGYAIAIACLLGVFSSFGDSLGCGVSGGLLGVFLDGWFGVCRICVGLRGGYC